MGRGSDGRGIPREIAGDPRQRDDALSFGDVGYAVDGRDVRSLTSEIGWRVAHELGHGTLTPRLNLAWLREHGGRFMSVGRLAGATDLDLTLPGRELSADGARLDASLDYRGESDRTWSVRWSSERRGDFSDGGLLLQLQSRF